MPIMKWDATYRAFGTIDRHGQAYVAMRSAERPLIDGAIKLRPGANIEHAIQRAAEINEHGPLPIHGQVWVEDADLPTLFGEVGRG